MPSEYSTKLEQIRDLLVNSTSSVAFTGAGFSTPSGISDFRSPGTGLWTRVAEIPKSGTIQGFAQDPQSFYDWFGPFAKLILEAEPNPAHYALAEMEALGFIQTVITQNADMLHQRAGTKHILEVHGSLAQATCIRCYKVAPALPMLEQFFVDGKVPICRECGGVMKPDVILTGEQLPAKVLVAARKAVRESDVMLIAGTSLSGGPATALVKMFLEHGAQHIIVNKTPSRFDNYAEVMIYADVVDVLPDIDAKLWRN